MSLEKLNDCFSPWLVENAQQVSYRFLTSDPLLQNCYPRKFDLSLGLIQLQFSEVDSWTLALIFINRNCIALSLMLI